jgi:hypothetical protein
MFSERMSPTNRLFGYGNEYDIGKRFIDKKFELFYNFDNFLI